jgi:cytochrome c biogenesis protein CcdA
MNFGPATYGLGLLAGAVSTLSPCVLPLVPVLIGSAVNAHRRGPLALGAGLASSFTIVGIALAMIGAKSGIDPDSLRTAGGVALAIFGAILVMPNLQELFARATSKLGDSGNRMLSLVRPDGLRGQFLVGLLLGVVWSPCVGPTLGAASTLASQGTDLAQIAVLMMLFGLGAAVPLIVLGSLSRSTLTRFRGRLLRTGQLGRQVLGLVMLGVGILVATGSNKPIEAWILDRSPGWLTALTTRY